MTGSPLAAGGVSPRVAQSILRHWDYKLTMNLYSHCYRGDEAKAIEGLPYLSRRTQSPPPRFESA